MKKDNFKINAGIIFLLIIFVIWVKPSYSLTISPATVEIETEPDATGNFTIKVYNESSKPLKLNVYVWDLAIDKNGKKIYNSPNPNSKNSIARFITPVEKEFILQSKDTKIVTFLINTPKTISGGNSAIAFFYAMPVIPKEKGAKALIAVSTRLGATILQETKGTVESKSRISSIKISRTKSDNPLEFQMKVLNEGNSFINASAVVGIIENENNFLGSFKIDKKIIPPNGEGLMSKEIKLDLKPGFYHAVVTYQYKGKTITINKPFNIE
jgi:hypothetical protein